MSDWPKVHRVGGDAMTELVTYVWAGGGVEFYLRAGDRVSRCYIEHASDVQSLLSAIADALAEVSALEASDGR